MQRPQIMRNWPKKYPWQCKIEGRQEGGLSYFEFSSVTLFQRKCFRQSGFPVFSFISMLWPSKTLFTLYKNISNQNPQPLTSLSLWLASSICIYFSAFKNLCSFDRSRVLYPGLRAAKFNCKIQQKIWWKPISSWWSSASWKSPYVPLAVIISLHSKKENSYTRS